MKCCHQSTIWLCIACEKWQANKVLDAIVSGLWCARGQWMLGTTRHLDRGVHEGVLYISYSVICDSHRQHENLCMDSIQLSHELLVAQLSIAVLSFLEPKQTAPVFLSCLLVLVHKKMSFPVYLPIIPRDHFFALSHLWGFCFPTSCSANAVKASFLSTRSNALFRFMCLRQRDVPHLSSFHLP